MTATRTITEEEARKYLMTPDPNDVSLYDHLTEIVHKIMESNPENIANNVGKLPVFSHRFKKHSFQPFPDKTPIEFRKQVEPDSRITERCTEIKRMFRQPKPSVSTVIEKPTPNVTVTTTTVKRKAAPLYRSVALEARHWELFGVGVPQHESYLIDLALTQLAAEYKLKELRFFGKIFGLQKDYLIVESARWYPDKDHKNYKEKHSMPNPPRKGVPVDVQPEPMGKGLNRYSYWVSSYASAAWVHLPDVTPQQLNAARQIKKFFTGNLDAPINSYPTFPGNETNYLRAQIARINAATQVSPSGALQRHEDDDDDDEEEEEEEEEGAPKKPKEEKTRPLTDPGEEWPGELEEGIKTLENSEMWVHHYECIYKTGRATKVPEKEVNEDEEEAEEEEEEDAEKEEEEKELLEPINRDKLFHKEKIPMEKTEEEEAEEEEEGEPEEKEEMEEKEEEEEEEEEDGEEDDKKRVPAWTCKLRNALYRDHGIVVVKSLRWPGAYAYAAEGGKIWGTIYMGNGLKASARSFAPTPAPEIQKEPDDIVEVADPPAKNEKLLLRGEELPENDSENGDEAEEEEEEEDP